MKTDEPGQHFWVFGYGSLMWNPGFDHAEAVPAQLFGLHRSPCIYSWVHRGTKERPGIVLGLDRGGTCKGMAFRISNQMRAETLHYLRARELVTHVYVETKRIIRLQSGTSVQAVTYVVDRNHEQYAGKLSKDDLVNQIRGAKGKSGSNDRYFIDTVRQMRKMGIRDSLIERVVDNL